VTGNKLLEERLVAFRLLLTEVHYYLTDPLTEARLNSFFANGDLYKSLVTRIKKQLVEGN